MGCMWPLNQNEFDAPALEQYQHFPPNKWKSEEKGKSEISQLREKINRRNLPEDQMDSNTTKFRERVKQFNQQIGGSFLTLAAG